MPRSPALCNFFATAFAAVAAAVFMTAANADAPGRPTDRDLASAEAAVESASGRSSS